MDSREPRQFTEGDLLFLRGYANLLAAAVDRLQFLDEIRDSNEQLERRVVERTRELTECTNDLTEANRRLRIEAAERKRAEEAWRQAQQTGTVVEHLPMGAGLIAPSGQIQTANAEFRRLLPGTIIPSMDGEASDEWVALLPDGRRIEPRDYPGARALRGEVALNVDFRHWSVARGEHWLRVSGIPVHDETTGVAAALLVLMDVNGGKRAAARQQLLTRELDHRAKNMLAVVQAALRLTRADDMAGFIQAIEGRVAALARAQALLAADRWSSADLHTLLRGELMAFLDVGGSGPRVDPRGPVVALPPEATQPVSIAIHELATNAVKYGALSVPAGRVTIHWEMAHWEMAHWEMAHWEMAATAGDMLRLRWTEMGGPPLDDAPTRRGFSSRVLNGTLRQQLGGTVDMTWKESGLVCGIELPLRQAGKAGDSRGNGWPDEEGRTG